MINRHVLVLARADALATASLVTISHLQDVLARSARRLRLLLAVELCLVGINKLLKQLDLIHIIIYLNLFE